ncbi:DNA topology modulation protein [Halobacillus andaensis]|uniref:DNA topology modulation protein n=1 Tax=Halobacillus andaensis TaxID=1176239 RepID=A0A917ETH6_HALAA|nr:DNA topology modulation protein [Halobacillus andaensis]
MEGKKIHIIGSVASGKTTLTGKLSAKLDIPYYELDNVVWIRNKEDIRRTEREREEYLNHILVSEAWIVEGVHHEPWMMKSFQEADVIIFLDNAYKRRKYRIIKRFIKQKLGFEKANYTPTFSIFIKMFKWNASFERNPVILEKLADYEEKLVIIRNDRTFIEEVKSCKLDM